jgi:hypothetical protein
MTLPFTISRTEKTLTFAQRLRNNAIWWGILMLLLELVGIPWKLWVFMLLIAFPTTALGVLCATAIEHAFFFHNKSSQPSTDNPREPKEPG